MADSPYVFERQSEYWTSRQMEEFFLDAGFELLAFPLTQLAEKEIPADFIFFDRGRSKLFGFQYKALYHNGDDYWPIDERQHRELSAYPWIYYCLSEITHVTDHRVALHLARIVDPRFEYRERLSRIWDRNVVTPTYSRWGGFYQGLARCFNGVLVHSDKEFRQLLIGDGENARLDRVVTMMVDTFLTDFDSKHTVHFSPLLAGERRE
jgi:hypothetical protein